MGFDVPQEHFDCVADRCCCLFLRRRGNGLSSGNELAYEFMLLPTLRFERFVWGLPGSLSAALFAFPPFDEVIARALVPNVAVPIRSSEINSHKPPVIRTFFMIRTRFRAVPVGRGW